MAGEGKTGQESSLGLIQRGKEKPRGRYTKETKAENNFTKDPSNNIKII